MRKNNVEILKDIKKLELEKARLVESERLTATTTYAKDETPIDNKYDYKEQNIALDNLDNEIRRLKHIITKSNCSLKIDGFDMCMNEALVYLAQLNNKRARLDRLSSREPLSRTQTRYDGVQFTKTNYDPSIALNDLREVEDEIQKLQMAIDLANLTNYLEI